MNLETLLSLPRNVKKTFFVIHDLLMVFIAFWFAQSLKAQYSDEWASMANWLAFGSTAFLTIALFVKLGLYPLRQYPRPDRRRIRQPDFSRLVLPDYPDF